MTPGVLSIPDLRRLLFVGFVASTVRWLEMLAAALFAYRVTESAFVVAMLGMVRLLPLGLFGAFIGGAADRFALRSGLVLLVAASLGGMLTLALLASLDALAVWHLALAAFLNGLCWAADNPVRRMMIGNAVGQDRIGSALSYDVGSNNAARIAGPLLAGALLARYGIASVFWLGTLLYAASLAAALRTPHGTRAASTHAAPFIGSIREGLAWLRGDRRLVGVFVITVVFNVFGWPCTSMIPVIATEVLHLDPTGVGLIAASEGVGGLIGALLLARLATSTGYGYIYVGSVAAYFVTMAGFATAPLATVAGAALLLNGSVAVGFTVMQATLVYRNSPIAMRARLLGLLSVCIGTGPVGFMYLGLLAELLTAPMAVVAIVAQGMLVLVLTRRWWIAVLQPPDTRIDRSGAT